MTVRIYRSTDASAPVLSGTVGALLTVLDAVLVNGYGSKTAAGWTIAYTGTNLRQYQMAAGGTSCQLYINDAGPGAGGAREARINGFKTGSAIGTGTGQFPSTAQQAAPSGAVVVRKSTTADSTARAWTIIADGRTFYMFVETGDFTGPLMCMAWMFGDFISYSSTDTSNCIIIGRNIENSSAFAALNNISFTGTNLYEAFGLFSYMSSTGLSNALSGHYVCANFTNTGTSINVGKHSDQTKMGVSGGGGMMMGYQGRWTDAGSGTSGATWTTQFSYPNGPDNGVYIAPVWIHHNGFVRGYLRGLWNPLQHLPLSHNDTYSGVGNFAGKSFIAMSIQGCQTASQGGVGVPSTPIQCHMEYSDTWS